MASGMKAQHKYIFLIFLILRSKTTHPSVLFEICKKTELQLQEAWWKNRHFGGQEVTKSRVSPSLLHPSLVLFTSLSLSTSQGFSVSLYLNNLCVSVFFVYFFFCVFLYFTICVSLSIANLFSTLTFSLSIYLSDPISQSNSLCSSLSLSLSSCLLRCACFSPSLYLTVCIYLSLSLSLANDASTLMWTSCRHPSGTTTILLTHIFLTCITWPLFSDGRRGSIGSQVRIPVKPNTRRKKEEKQCNWFTQAHVNCEN